MMDELEELWLQRNLERRIVFIQPTPEMSTAVIATNTLWSFGRCRSLEQIVHSRIHGYIERLKCDRASWSW